MKGSLWDSSIHPWNLVFKVGVPIPSLQWVSEDDCPYQFKISIVRPYDISINEITRFIIEHVSISSKEKVNIREMKASQAQRSKPPTSWRAHVLYLYLSLSRQDLNDLYLASRSEQYMGETHPVSCRKHWFIHSSCCTVLCPGHLQLWCFLSTVAGDLVGPSDGLGRRTSLAVQWSRHHLPTQGSRVPSLVGKLGSHMLRGSNATKPHPAQPK